jgi:hypothetical protein
MQTLSFVIFRIDEKISIRVPHSLTLIHIVGYSDLSYVSN